MNELGQGFTYDLSKTFDTDDLTRRVEHLCPAPTGGKVLLLQPGTACPYCGKLVKQPIE